MRALGQIRVDRGTGSSEPLQKAIDALHRGEAIGIFPQGTIPRGEAFFEPQLRGKTGVARLATAAEVPVVPVAMWNNEKIWPRSERIPKVTELLKRTPVSVKIGEPIYLKATEDLHKLTQQVMDKISSLLPDEVRNPPPPTEDQIRAATPPS
jgi:putative phosphoserine phosphatase/1-acylglycerol-3-phosphate O-acyltransferase